MTDPERLGVEVWFRKVLASSAIDLHRDKDERLALAGELRTPVTSTIIYLSSSGGPTAFVDSAGERVALSFPEERFSVRFNGSLAHSVLGFSGRGTRFTLIANRWHEKPVEPYCVPWQPLQRLHKRAQRVLSEQPPSTPPRWIPVDLEEIDDSDLASARRPLSLRPIDLQKDEQWPATETLLPHVDRDQFIGQIDSSMRGTVRVHSIRQKMLPTEL